MVREWQKLQSKNGCDRFIRELKQQCPQDLLPDGRNQGPWKGMTLQFLKAISAFYVVIELPVMERRGHIWHTCTCGDYEHQAECVHVISIGIKYHGGCVPPPASIMPAMRPISGLSSDAYKNQMPASVSQHQDLQEKRKVGRPSNIQRVRNWWR
jgi:hypothetical protein